MSHLAEPQLSFYDTNFEDRVGKRSAIDIPLDDNVPGALDQLLAANLHFRDVPWPSPFQTTQHQLRLSDARDLS